MKFRSDFRKKICFAFASLALAASVAGCASPTVGEASTGFVTQDVASAYIPLRAQTGLFNQGFGAAVAVEPGIAVTNAHNSPLIAGSGDVIGKSPNYDLMFFHTAGDQTTPSIGRPHPGESVIAYGQGHQATLRMAIGTVQDVNAIAPAICEHCKQQHVFNFVADAGEGFSGGPVVDAATGKVLGIVFGYADEDGKRFMYAYDMDRVTAELSALRQEASLQRY